MPDAFRASLGTVCESIGPGRCGGGPSQLLTLVSISVLSAPGPRAPWAAKEPHPGQGQRARAALGPGTRLPHQGHLTLQLGPAWHRAREPGRRRARARGASGLVTCRGCPGCLPGGGGPRKKARGRATGKLDEGSGGEEPPGWRGLWRKGQRLGLGAGRRRGPLRGRRPDSASRLTAHRACGRCTRG